jgi:RNA-dependent RNA polymerase
MLRDHNISIDDGKHFRTVLERPEPVWRWIDISDSKARFRSTLEEMAHNDYVYLPFEVRYQLEVCLSQRHLSEFTMSREFIVRLMELGAASAVRLLEHVATNKEQYLDPMKIFKIRYPKGISDSAIPSYCCFMRTARVTPTTVHYNTPTIDTSNRVTRNYQEFLDRFLRVRFTDEKTQGRIYSSPFKSNDEIFVRIKRTLTNGITIGDRHYEFLAFGNSQFREHGAYFFAPTPNLTAAHIRAWMGQFNHIRNVARYAARLGQCFSTTRALAGCNVTVKQIPDIIRNGYCFSDGIGKISRFTTRVISVEMGILNPYGEPPSAYQFRLGGCKGMLTVSSDPIVNDVHIRPSQIKFEAEHKRLEIIRWSQLSAATLNRQLILVLSALGIKGQVFHDRLNTMLESISYAMDSDKQAIELLEKFIDPNRTTLALAEMVSAGFRRTNEPFVSSMLALWKSWHQKYLKEKAKILVEEGASLLGVLDETGTLRGYFNRAVSKKRMTKEENLAALPEIFIQVSSMEKGVRPRVIQGVCIVARNPSLHPGDIRVVRAVDCEALRHLLDVIVFPQTGDRDVSSMCSGGDLDGDDYLVIWDQDLVPKQWFAKPLIYSSNRAPDLDRQVTINDITSFYVTYMKNDSLPRIAHAHMAHGDHLLNGVYEPKCVRLAELHSDAVDYNKTGIPAVMGRGLEPRVWPHFMDKKNKRSYHSKRILGQLYDAVKTEDFSPKLSNPFDSRILECSLVEASKKFEQFASELKVNYDTSMRRIMAQYGIQTEFEVWTTFVLEHNSMSRDYKLHEDLGKVASGLRSSIQEQCYKHLGGKRDFGHVAPLAVAMYRVTHQEVQDALATLRGEVAYDDHDDVPGLPDEQEIEITRLPLISYPWVFYSVLCTVARSAVDELQNALAEAQAIDARKVPSKFFTHAEVMKIVGQTDFTVRDEAGARAPAETDAEFGHHGLDRDLYENDLYQETGGGGFSSVPKEEMKQDDGKDRDVVVTANDGRASATELVLLTNEHREGIKEKVERAIEGPLGEDDDEDDGDVHIIEREGDVKPSAIDELIALVGDDYDADDDDW